MAEKVLYKLQFPLLKGKSLCSGLELFRCLLGHMMMMVFQWSTSRWVHTLSVISVLLILLGDIVLHRFSQSKIEDMGEPLLMAVLSGILCAFIIKLV